MRRPARGLLANQLQFPCLELAEARGGFCLFAFGGARNRFGLQRPVRVPRFAEADLASGASQLQALLASFGLEVDLEPRAGALEHLFSHERHVMHVFQGHLEKKPASQEAVCRKKTHRNSECPVPRLCSSSLTGVFSSVF